MSFLRSVGFILRRLTSRSAKQKPPVGISILKLNRLPAHAGHMTIDPLGMRDTSGIFMWHMIPLFSLTHTVYLSGSLEYCTQVHIYSSCTEGIL